MRKLILAGLTAITAGALLVGPAQAGGNHDRDRNPVVVDDHGSEFERHKDHDHGRDWWGGRKCKPRKDHPKPPETTVPPTTVPPPTTAPPVKPPVDKPEKPKPIHGTATSKTRKAPAYTPTPAGDRPQPNYTPPEFDGSTGPTPFAG